MTDVNLPLRESYYALLNGNVFINAEAIPFYYSQLPTGDHPDNYILVNTIYSTGFNSNCINYTLTTVELLIVTKAFNNNSGADCDNIAMQILNIIIPSPQAKAVQISNGQVINTVLAQDRVITGLTDGEKKLINRVVGFQHRIGHN